MVHVYWYLKHHIRFSLGTRILYLTVITLYLFYCNSMSMHDFHFRFVWFFFPVFNGSALSGSHSSTAKRSVLQRGHQWQKPHIDPGGWWRKRYCGSGKPGRYKRYHSHHWPCIGHTIVDCWPQTGYWPYAQVSTEICAAGMPLYRIFEKILRYMDKVKVFKGYIIIFLRDNLTSIFKIKIFKSLVCFVNLTYSYRSLWFTYLI